MSAKPRGRELPEDGAIFRLKAIIALGDAARLTEEPVHPDHELLERCAEVLDLRAAAEAVHREARKMPRTGMQNPAFAAEIAKRDRLLKRSKAATARICKFASKTPAGIYAKALVLRNGYGTAPRLTVSLCEDLIDCPGLRQSLWPAEREAS